MVLKNKIVLLFFLAYLCLFSVPLSAQPTIPDRPYNHIVDLAGIINDNVEANLNRYLLELEQKTTAQMIVLTVNSLEGEPIEDFSISVAHDKWKLGQKGKDNGLLLVVSLQDREYRIETGYGIEGIIPDSRAGSIGREYLVPYFRKGDYSTGIFAASLALISEIATDAGVEITGMPKLRTRSTSASRQRSGRKPTLLGSIFTILLFIGLIYMFIKHPRLLLFLLFMNMLGGGRRSHWGGSGGFGGGGFGGGSFGGGGGGGFGGGGASGGW
jgi:uncharacterized protein